MVVSQDTSVSVRFSEMYLYFPLELEIMHRGVNIAVADTKISFQNMTICFVGVLESCFPM